MAHGATPQTCEGVDCSTLSLIVVGAHLRAEIEDRPQAYRLHDRLRDWVQANPTLMPASGPLKPAVCTDIWFLNNPELQDRPVICLGEPGVNAATAFLCTRLPTAFMVDGSLRIHLDQQYTNVQACLWGVNAKASATAVDLFIERYLDGFMREAVEI